MPICWVSRETSGRVFFLQFAMFRPDFTNTSKSFMLQAAIAPRDDSVNPFTRLFSPLSELGSRFIAVNEIVEFSGWGRGRSVAYGSH